MTQKKEETKEEPAFDINEALENLEYPRMFVDGFKAYITNRNLEPKSKREFEKLLKEFGEIQM